MQFILIVCYPLLAHFAVITQIPALQIMAIVSLSAGLLYKGLRQRRIFSWSILCFVALCMIVLSYMNMGFFLIYLPSMIIPILLLNVFFRSLLPGKIPLVTDIGEKSRGPLTDQIREYTRNVTIIWVVLFFAMSTWSILLLWLGTPALWSLFTNVINYILVGILFFGEFIFRKWRFPEHDHPNFIQYIRIVVQANIRKA